MLAYVCFLFSICIFNVIWLAINISILSVLKYALPFLISEKTNVNVLLYMSWHESKHEPVDGCMMWWPICHAILVSMYENMSCLFCYTWVYFRTTKLIRRKIIALSAFITRSRVNWRSPHCLLYESNKAVTLSSLKRGKNATAPPHM